MDNFYCNNVSYNIENADKVKHGKETAMSIFNFRTAVIATPLVAVGVAAAAQFKDIDRIQANPEAGIDSGRLAIIQRHAAAGTCGDLVPRIATMAPMPSIANDAVRCEALTKAEGPTDGTMP